jgi:hypothetical protein
VADLRIIIVVLACAGAALAGDGALRFEPSPGRVYKVEGDLGFENWAFALVVPGSAGDSIDELAVVHRARGAVVHSERLQGLALAPRIEAAGGSHRRVKDLYFQLPARCETDRVDVSVRLHTGVTFHASAPLARYAQRNRYRLPVRGTWFVSSGHDFGVEHRRHLSRGHFAWDPIRVDARGRSSSGPRLEQHYALGQPVLAPAHGTVAVAVDGLPDNPPGRPTEHANHIVIDHGHGEFSRLAHLKRGSVRVRPGDRVRDGQLIAKVGNSGMSEAPHLHIGFERHDRGESREDADPIPVAFSGYILSWNQGAGIRVSAGRPRRGQFIEGD